MSVQPQEQGQATSTPKVERIDTVVIGGGQAGLAMGYHLARLGQRFVILDAGARVGDSWRARWDSLRLFTPARRDGLPGMKYPGRGHAFPTRDELADYLEGYAAHFELPVQCGVRVDALARVGERFLVAAGDRRIEADQVVVATGPFQAPHTPPFARELDPRIVQLHSARYRNPSQLQDGDVLVVGPGNSGVDIAMELAATGRRVLLSGEHPGHIPIAIEGLSGRLVFPALWFVWTHVLNRNTPIGRRVLPKIAAGHEPLIRTKPKHIEAAGIERVPRTAGIANGRPLLDDGRELDVANVVWATGYRRSLEWIDLPGFDADEEPTEGRGAIASEPGLYVVGRQLMHAFNSHTVGGVGRDAEYIARQIAARRVDMAHA
jgi:putative flavoprotein involved in K+ transport